MPDVFEICVAQSKIENPQKILLNSDFAFTLKKNHFLGDPMCLMKMHSINYSERALKRSQSSTGLQHTAGPHHSFYKQRMLGRQISAFFRKEIQCSQSAKPSRQQAVPQYCQALEIVVLGENIRNKCNCLPQIQEHLKEGLLFHFCLQAQDHRIETLKQQRETV